MQDYMCPATFFYQAKQVNKKKTNREATVTEKNYEMSKGDR